SPKLNSALTKRFNFEELWKQVRFWKESVDTPYRAQFKIVVGNDNDIQIYDDLLSKMEDCNTYNFILQVEESKVGNKEFVAKCFNLIKKFPSVRLLIQQHKYLGLR